MIVDDAASLQMGIDGDRSDVLEAPLLEFSAYSVRQAVAHRDFTIRMAVVYDGPAT